ncbi:MFS transporter [Gordonia rhizosphera]|uniref:Putative drug resistance transporter n=1 Tax=Gordonia rhizosphera NBRC 16068 TaxID=1108045 RepID=K6WXF0_9ACTN|nr:MFS transporter [Gordonia rhizosphera]GAB91229.1 putative drug resistance transporter [Gordonia rhizosphera NBRC 16068]
MDSVVVQRHPHPWRVFTATSIGVIAVFVAMSGLTVALPTLTRELNASTAQSTWIVLGYMVVTTALILVFGRLSDIVGRRPLYLAGLVVFTIATALCIVSPSAGWLIAARVVQGVGAAAVVTNNTSLLTDMFPPHLLGRALGWNATVAAVAQVIGPVIGGAMTAMVGWRGLFVAVLPVALIATVTSVMVIPRARRRPARRERFDVTGAVLSVVMLTTVVLALTPGLSSPTWLPWAYLAVGAASTATFVTVQMRRTDPLVDLTLFRSRGIALVLVAAFTIAVATYAVPLIISLYEQAADDASPFTAGLLVTPVAIGTVLAASVAGSLVARVAPRTLAASGMALAAIGLLGMTLTLSVDDGALPVTMSFLFVIGTGIGLFMTPSTSALMLTVSYERRGIANGLRSTLQNVGNLLSTAMTLAIVTVGLGAAAQEAAYGGTPGALSSAELDRFVDNLRTVGLTLTVVAVVGVGLCLAFPRHRVATEPLEFPHESLTTIKESA